MNHKYKLDKYLFKISLLKGGNELDKKEEDVSSTNKLDKKEEDVFSTNKFDKNISVIGLNNPFSNIQFENTDDQISNYDIDDFMEEEIELCGIDCFERNMAQIIDSTIKIYNTTDPLMQIYGNILFYNMKEDRIPKNIYINHTKSGIWSIADNDYNIYNKKESKYSVDEIPVYLRKKPELVEMYHSDYYNFFNFSNLKQNELNPTYWFSQKCSRYIISPTIDPVSPDHILLIGYNLDNNEYLTNYDFYYNLDLIEEMYSIFCSLTYIDKKYFVYTSIGVGSLPETYHLHVMKYNNVPFSQIDNLKINKFKIDKFFITMATIYKDHRDLHNLPMVYFFGIPNKAVKRKIFFKNIIKILYDTRLDGEFVYYPQLFMMHIGNPNNKFNWDDDEPYSSNVIVITFRRVKTEYIKLAKKINPTQYVPEYYDSLFGKIKSKYNLLYLPIDWITYYGRCGKTWCRAM